MPRWAYFLFQTQKVCLACAHFPADIGHRRPALDLPERVHNRLLADFDRFMVPRFVIWSVPVQRECDSWGGDLMHGGGFVG
jgi:hypothetical protein